MSQILDQAALAEKVFGQGLAAKPQGLKILIPENNLKNFVVTKKAVFGEGDQPEYVAVKLHGNAAVTATKARVKTLAQVTAQAEAKRKADNAIFQAEAKQRRDARDAELNARRENAEFAQLRKADAERKKAAQSETPARQAWENRNHQRRGPQSRSTFTGHKPRGPVNHRRDMILNGGYVKGGGAKKATPKDQARWEQMRQRAAGGDFNGISLQVSE